MVRVAFNIANKLQIIYQYVGGNSSLSFNKHPSAPAPEGRFRRDGLEVMPRNYQCQDRTGMSVCT